ncbi:MAG: LamG-like jellyroll fold domain-containing protein [Bacteroidota bacterium]
MKKIIFLLVVIATLQQTCLAQAPAIEWQNTIGGNDDEILYSIQQTKDGGYILGGNSQSGISGDKTETTQGGYDYWVVKLNTSGNIQWQYNIGGNGDDQLKSIQQTTDGGYILGGYSDSGISGNKTEGSQGSYDYWVLKLDSSGIIQWQNTLGGNNFDFLFSIEQTMDGGYILGGTSFSDMSGDKTEGSQGSSDYWVLKLSSSGTIQWQNTIGGNAYEGYLSIHQTTDGGYILGGYSSSSISGDKTEASLGNVDYWVVKLSSSGVIEWQNTIGGTNVDELYSIQQTRDGGYILGGYSNSGISGDKTEATQGIYDYWVVKLNSSGVIQWQKTIGGNNYDYLFSIQQTTDGGYILGGYSQSDISGDKTQASHGNLDFDYWVVKLNSTGVIQWQNTIGGSLFDNLYSIQQTTDGGYILGGHSNSGISGDKTETSLGSSDYWVVKLCGNPTFYADADGDGFGNIAYDTVACSQPIGYVSDSTDCNDADSLKHAVFNFYSDSDHDGYGSGNLFPVCAGSADLPPYGYAIYDTDCDDNNAGLHPGIEEICNNTDDNCDGITDNILFSGTKLYMPFNSGSLQDVSGNAHHAVSFIDLTDTLDRDSLSHTAYYFNGTDSKIEIADHADFHSVNITLAAWIKVDGNNSGEQTIISKAIGSSGNVSWSLFYNSSSDRLGAHFGTGSFNQTSVVPLSTTLANGKWNHVAWAFSDYPQGVSSLYINGVFAGSFASGATLGYTNDPIEIGINHGTDLPFDGSIDEPLIVNRKLSTAEINWLYLQGPYVKQPIYYADLDGDGFGNLNFDSTSCFQPTGYVLDSTDCNDSQININPDAFEVCNNGIDDNCDGLTDTYLPSGLKLYMPLNGDANDVSGFYHHGSVIGGSFTTGHTGSAQSAYSCFGNPQHIEVPDHADLRPTSLTLSVWVNYSSVPGDIQSIIGKGYCSGWSDSYSFWFQNGQLNAGLGYASYGLASYTFSAPTSGQWHHLAMTFDDLNDTAKVYIDNVLKGTFSATFNLLYESSALMVGADFDQCGTNWYYDGKVDEVMLFDRALSATEIEHIYNFTTPIPIESCNGIDDNCNGLIDEGLLHTYYADADSDSYGNISVSVIICDTVAPAGYVTDSTDCNDNNANIHPNLTDECNGIDENCSGLADENCLVKFQYYFDTEPGVGVTGNGGFINAASVTDSAHIISSIATTGLTEGFHILYIRAQSVIGVWGLWRSYPFTITPTSLPTTQTVTDAEYFFDTETGVANAIQLPIGVTPSDSVRFQSAISITGLIEGFHTLYIRIKDSYDHWSLWRSYPFVITPAPSVGSIITDGEAFFDTDPGVGNGMQLWEPVANPANNVHVAREVFVPNTQADGTHYIYFRFKDASGKWSLHNRAQYTVSGSTCIHTASITPNDSVLLCPTDSLLLTENSMGDFTWQWKKNDVIIPGATNRFYYAKDNGIYTCTIVSGTCTFISDSMRIDPSLSNIWYVDMDNDSYGSTASSILACIQPTGYTLDSTDCNDANAQMHPNAVEVCNGSDDDCDEIIDESCMFVLNLRAFIEGFYTGNETMTPVLNNLGMSQSLFISDSITVELHDALNPGTTLYSQNSVIGVNGYAIFYIPTSLNGTTAYIALKNRNSIETWSKLPVTISASNTYDFTQ